MCESTCTCVDIYTYVCVPMCANEYLNGCGRVRARVRARVCARVRACVRAYVRARVRPCACTSVPDYLCTYVQTRPKMYE